MQLNDNDIGPILLWKDVQESRPDWAQVSPGSPALKNYWGQWDRLKRKEGVLYRELESDSGNSVMLQLIVPKKLQQEILTQAHNHRLSGHLMAKKTLGRIRDKFYWSGYRRSVENWCRGCDQCASRKGPSKKFNAELKQYGSGHTMQRCAMDIMGPLPKSTRGNRYVLVIADYFTKWTEAYPMADMEAETVARLLVDSLSVGTECLMNYTPTRAGNSSRSYFNTCVGCSTSTKQEQHLSILNLMGWLKGLIER
ncbi:Retrovirus-related Pol polyprotein from transposon [Apostichopus japonicus]|uniref:Retrovirus-related Pol polyprotein from transposon n=1 Tax=Stichopus japonicus TaxID=307972 RepID=A0A2G8JG26_STIJA|nr:Retrovirus-related Pol polyprotein from transposon [Apostichopus japonicus]